MKQTLTDKRTLDNLLAQIVFDGKMDLFKRYLENMEGFLEAEARRHQERVKDLREEVKTGKLAPPNEPPPEQQDIDLQLEMLDDELEIQLEMVSQFTNILRKSFFVDLYGFLESRLTAECRRAREQARDDILLSPSDIKGKGIIRAKTYLVKVLRVNFSFGTSREWQEIQEYRILRNCIVHNEGRLDQKTSPRDANRLREYVDRKQALILCDDEVLLDKGFCEEVLHTILEFLLSLRFPSDAQD